MIEDEGTQDDRAPSEPPQDPTQNPAPPANPETDHEAVEKGRENIERIVGN
jgi:hypothetical protein